MKRFIAKLALLAFLTNLAQAGLPPTTSKISGDSSDKVTFKYQFPNFVGTHSGSAVSLTGLSGGTFDLGTITNSSIDSTNTVTLFDNLFTLQDGIDATKQVVFQLGNQTTGTTTTFTTRGTANRNYNLPDRSITFSGFSSTPGAHTVILGSGTNDLTATATGTSGQALISGGSGADPAFGTLGISFGGTGQVTASAAFGALSPLTTKGDILGYSTLNARVPVGADGTYLVADSTQTLGVKWSATGTSSLNIPNATDWASFTPTWSSDGTPPALGNGTISGRYRRNGDSVDVEYYLTPGGTTTFGTGSYSMSLPAGLVIDTTKTAPNAIDTSHQMEGTGWWGTTDTGTANYTGSRVGYASTTAVRFIWQNNASGTDTFWGATSPYTFGNGDYFFGKATSIPIVGYSANTAVTVIGTALPFTTLGDTLYEDATPAPARLAGNITATKKFLTQTGNGSISAAPSWGTIAASDLAGQHVYLQYTGNGATSITANVTNIDFSTAVVDNNSAWNGTTFTAPRAGFYDFNGEIRQTSTASAIVAYVNGTAKIQVTSDATSLFKPFSGSIFLNASDVLSIRSDTSMTLVNNALTHWISISSQ